MGPVRVRFLGSGEAFASGDRFQAYLRLDDGAEPLLLDCGATALIPLKRAAIDPASIGWVALSHLHGDHFAGLPWLILDGQFAKRTTPLVSAGPEGVEAALCRSRSVTQLSSPQGTRAGGSAFRVDRDLPVPIGEGRVPNGYHHRANLS